MNDEQLENARNSSDPLIFDLADAVVKLRVELRIARQSRDRLRAALSRIQAVIANQTEDDAGRLYDIARKALEEE